MQSDHYWSDFKHPSRLPLTYWGTVPHRLLLHRDSGPPLNLIYTAGTAAHHLKQGHTLATYDLSADSVSGVYVHMLVPADYCVCTNRSGAGRQQSAGHFATLPPVYCGYVLQRTGLTRNGSLGKTQWLLVCLVDRYLRRLSRFVGNLSALSVDLLHGNLLLWLLYRLWQLLPLYCPGNSTRR